MFDIYSGVSLPSYMSIMYRSKMRLLPSLLVVGITVMTGNHLSAQTCQEYSISMNGERLTESFNVSALAANGCMTPEILSIGRATGSLDIAALGAMDQVHPYVLTELLTREITAGRFDLDRAVSLDASTTAIIVDFALRSDRERLRLYRLAFSHLEVDGLSLLSEGDVREALQSKLKELEQLQDFALAICLKKFDSPRLPLDSVVKLPTVQDCLINWETNE